MSVVEKFEQWCVVEIMGHKRFAGLVTEQSVGGTSFVRIDIPEVTTSSGQKLPAFTKLFGAASIYCLSPCTEETARAFAATIRAEGFALYEAPRLPAPAQNDEAENHCVDCGCDIGKYSLKCDECDQADDLPDPVQPPSQADIDEFAKALGVEPETPPVLNPGDDGFTDPLDGQPF